MKKIITVFLLVIISAAFCQSGDDLFIKNLATKLKNNDVWIAIPVQLEKNDANIVMKNTYLYQYYLKEKFNFDFYTFFKGVLDHSYKINYSSFGMANTGNVINQNSEIFATYRKLGFDKFKRTFFIAGKRQLKLKNSQDQARVNGIIKIMFDHKYYILFDDELGNLYFYINPPVQWR